MPDWEQTIFAFCPYIGLVEIAHIKKEIGHAEAIRTEQPERALAIVKEAWMEYIRQNIADEEIQTKAPRLMFSLLIKNGGDAYKQAIELAETYLALPAVQNNPLLQAEMTYLKSKALRYGGQTLDSLPFALQALELFDKAHYNTGNYFEVLGGLSYNYLLLSKFEESFVYNNRHLELARQKNEAHQQYIALYYAACLHHRIGNLHQSCIEHIQAIRFSKKSKLPHHIYISSYSDVAILLNAMGKYRLAERFFELSIEAFETNNDLHNQVWAMLQYFISLQQQRKFEKMQADLDKYEKVLSDFSYGSYKYQIANFKAQALLAQNKPEPVAQLVPVLIESLSQPLQDFNMGNMLGTLSNYYEQIGDFKQALFYSNKLAENRRDTFNSERASRLRSMQIQHNIANAKREKEEAERLARLKQEFLANMSHEIRSPMNAVIALSSLLAEDEMPAEQKRKVNIIKRSSENLLGIINDVLDNAKIEAGKFTIEQIVFGLHELIAEIRDTLQYKADDKGLILKTAIESNVPEFATGDPTRLRQVFINLLNNALKFTRAGSVTLTARQTLAGAITFEIADTGIGISKQQTERIFAGYTQASSDTARNFGGTGLGLKISKELVQLMGGQLQLESEEGKGSRFWFNLPLAEARHPEGITANSQFMYAGAPLKFLIADDISDNRFVISKLLQKYFAGCSYSEAEDGNQAVQMALQSKYDLILMDIDMPVINGIEAAIKIRESRPQQKILASSANVFLSGEELKSFGFIGFLLKPFTQMQFEERMRALFG